MTSIGMSDGESLEGGSLIAFRGCRPTLLCSILVSSLGDVVVLPM